MAQTCIHVAIGLVCYQSKVLVGWRTAKQHQGNKYEFPGGKVEAGETAQAACRREVLEEVGVDLLHWHPFTTIQHQYEDVQVTLHIFKTHVAVEQLQQIKAPWSWYERQALADLNFPAANQAIIDRLLWPNLLKISTEVKTLEQLETQSADRLTYLRCEPKDIITTLQCVQQLDTAVLSRLVLNIDVWSKLNAQQQTKIAAVHFKQQQLMQLDTLHVPYQVATIAACHDLKAIRQANQLGMDAIILSPVLATPTHPEQLGIGWNNFAAMAQQAHCPVFALGGMQPADLVKVQQHYGYGVAGIRHF